MRYDIYTTQAELAGNICLASRRQEVSFCNLYNGKTLYELLGLTSKEIRYAKPIISKHLEDIEIVNANDGMLLWEPKTRMPIDPGIDQIFDCIQ